ncbi:MAG TPA: ABC transporter permease [Vicinamibacteria bacterium]|nr:ABC transporter permease [Vicinamibacteria bacterium]
MRVLWRVIVKEFLQIRRDRKMIPVIFVAPIVQITVFGFAVNTDVTNVPTVLVDQDRSAASRDLVSRFVESGYFEIVGTGERAVEVDRWLVTSRAQLGLVIGEGFGRALASSRSASVQLVVDGTDAASANIALGYASALARDFGAAVLERRLRAAGASVPPVGQAVLVPRVFYNPDLKSRWFYVPAVLAMILMIMTMLLSAMGVVREKEIGTMEQLIVTPIRPWQLLVGKLLPFALIGLFQMCVATAVTVFGFGVPLRGSFALLLGLTTLFVLSTLGLGLFVSTLVQNQQQAMMGAVFAAMVPMIYLSGLIFPIENMPRAIQLVTYLIPLRYYAEIIRGVFLRGSGIGVLWPEALVLLGMGVTILTVASLRFRKRLD